MFSKELDRELDELSAVKPHPPGCILKKNDFSPVLDLTNLLNFRDLIIVVD